MKLSNRLVAILGAALVVFMIGNALRGDWLLAVLGLVVLASLVALRRLRLR